MSSDNPLSPKGNAKEKGEAWLIQRYKSAVRNRGTDPKTGLSTETLKKLIKRAIVNKKGEPYVPTKDRKGGAKTLRGELILAGRLNAAIKRGGS